MGVAPVVCLARGVPRRRPGETLVIRGAHDATPLRLPLAGGITAVGPLAHAPSPPLSLAVSVGDVRGTPVTR